jgi:hypothetical protein
MVARLLIGRTTSAYFAFTCRLETLLAIEMQVFSSVPPSTVFEPLHARFNFTLESCAHDESLNSLGDLLDYSPSDVVLERVLSGEQVFSNPHRESTEKMARHFESCRRTTPTSTMSMFVLPKGA